MVSQTVNLWNQPIPLLGPTMALKILNVKTLLFITH